MTNLQAQIGSFMGDIWHRTQRTKSGQSSDDLMETQLRRCLTTLDIILLGIGHMVGSGAYVITSSVAKNIAGPAIVLSYIISGLAAFLCALCYAEFSSRYPKCGSAYSYTYIALGEVWAFIVGWNMILENVIGIAAVSRACSAYLDSTIGGEIKNYTNQWYTPVLGEDITHNMDLMAGLIALGFAIFLTCGMRVTTYINNAFSVINIIAIVIIITVGGYFSDWSNWTNVPGGFMPFGWKGVFAGSASCFYAYVGFDSIATSGEEAKDPQRSIPFATFVSMICATISYVGVSIVMTLMVPYNQIADESGLPDALGIHGAVWAKFAVIIGACCGMATVLIGTIYSLSRVVYSISSDGLLFPWMSYINTKTQIPLQAMFFFTGFGMLLAIFIDITTLVEMMSIGTLIAYLVVSASIIVVRYKKDVDDITKIVSPTSKPFDDEDDDGDAEHRVQDSSNGNRNNEDDEHEKLLHEHETKYDSIRSAFGDIINSKVILECLDQYFRESLVPVCVSSIVVLSALFCLTCKLFNKDIDDKLIAFLLSMIGTFLIIIVWVIHMQEQNTEKLRYKVPFVPILPVVSIFFNVSLIVNLNWLTWMRFILWMILGFSIYFLYGIKHSKAQYGPELSTKINQSKNKSWGSIENSDTVEDVSVLAQ
ncbi:hypothetical protein BLOT_006449 [Blomia tropicalis]|nr:hypothetical protein BLOT_006449 [Blomia tropicalis]